MQRTHPHGEPYTSPTENPMRISDGCTHVCVPLECIVCKASRGFRGRRHANDPRMYPCRHSIPLGVFLWGCFGAMSNFCPRNLHGERIPRRKNGRYVQCGRCFYRDLRIFFKKFVDHMLFICCTVQNKQI